MNRISSLNYSTAETSGSSLEEEGHPAHDSAQGEMTISQMASAKCVNKIK